MKRNKVWKFMWNPIRRHHSEIEGSEAERESCGRNSYKEKTFAKHVRSIHTTWWKEGKAILKWDCLNSWMWGTGFYSTTTRKERLWWKKSRGARPGGEFPVCSWASWLVEEGVGHKCRTVTTGNKSVTQKPWCKDTEKLLIECSTRNSYNRSGMGRGVI